MPSIAPLVSHASQEQDLSMLRPVLDVPRAPSLRVAVLVMTVLVVHIPMPMELSVFNVPAVTSLKAHQHRVKSARPMNTPIRVLVNAILVVQELR